MIQVCFCLAKRFSPSPLFFTLNFWSPELKDSSPTPDPEDELDDPYVHTVSTEEFIEIIEQASQEEAD
ncbi:hypothetical protein HMF3257_38820 [Spirosoma telluris]|uniref:Uncharacterized protein n=2 Tax=Spirosoma telluris TaxID=2183553 RepID=A0A327NCA6_9BACT|nr:hypothetical protein HMF3257_38820 [Spirosoma telluris]